mmetsp:Transcript_21761/g.32245  ORF Transcript_21761/g.32245 Transcript_21761/m.32245 type:complete len:260 (-) Transcript_21761:29-808(-)
MMRILSFITFASAIFSASAFAPSLSVNTRASSHLSASESNEPTMTRRDVGIKSAAVATSGVLAGFNLNSQEASAEEGADGRLIEFTVENVGGEEGQTGKVVMKLRKDWAPIGAERFEKLTEVGFWDEARAFRVLPGFIVQFGINADPAKQALWRKSIADDAVKVSNKRGTVTFATAGPGTRTTQIFFNTGNNVFLDKQGFSPIGEIVEGLDVVDKFYAGYGEGAPSGKGPNQGLVQAKGNEYLTKSFPKLSYFSSAKFI